MESPSTSTRGNSKLIEDTEPACGNPVCRAGVLPLIFRLSRTVAENNGLEPILEVVLQLMEEELGMIRGMINLYDSQAGRIYIHKSLGLTEDEEARGVYGLGEGITGRVVETGLTMVVPRIGDEDGFLDRTGSHHGGDEDHAFLCIPIARGRRLLGTISGERPYGGNQALLDQDVELLKTIGCLIAPPVELHLVETHEKAEWAAERHRLQDALKERFHPANIIGNSRPMRDVYRLIAKIAPSKATVLILGESGVGKELVASAIHYKSPVAEGPFIKFNCAALPENLVESELFGHEKGAFTGAIGARKGRFEEADGGTIFLDEVGELSLAMQAKLLRILQEKTFERVGGNRPVKVDIRIVAATNRDLAAMVGEGTFRSDLYYRLWVVPIMIPALRERGSDIVALADHFVASYSRENGKEVKRISTPALDMLMSYHWPGNVRELENVIERAVLLSDDDVIHGYHLPPSLQTAKLSGTVFRGNLEAKLEAVEYEMLVEALKNSKGNMSKAAQELGLTKRMIGIRMAKFNIDYRTFRRGVSAPSRAGLV
nr:sigma 54-interacting transcriptional regulator [uncultured Holophaga sp.]